MRQSALSGGNCGGGLNVVRCGGDYAPAVVVGAVRLGSSGVCALVAVPFEELGVGAGAPPAAALHVDYVVVGRREGVEVVLDSGALQAVGVA